MKSFGCACIFATLVSVLREVILPAVLFAFLFVCPFPALSQSTQTKTFTLRILKIKRVDDGCTVEAESATVRFKISSDTSAVCGMLKASETYKALRATIENDPKDETKDAPILVIYNNTENVRRENAVFNIDSEEAIR